MFWPNSAGSYMDRTGGQEYLMWKVSTSMPNRLNHQRQAELGCMRRPITLKCVFSCAGTDVAGDPVQPKRSDCGLGPPGAEGDVAVCKMQPSNAGGTKV